MQYVCGSAHCTIQWRVWKLTYTMVSMVSKSKDFNYMDGLPPPSTPFYIMIEHRNLRYFFSGAVVGESPHGRRAGSAV
jgi:hypothetical protein